MNLDSDFSYVLPLRWERGEEVREALAEYLSEVTGWCDDVLVVDGSPPDVFVANAIAFERLRHLTSGAEQRFRHLTPDPAHHCLSGKVAGSLTGIEAARHDLVVIADDDVRYDLTTLTRVVGLLGDHDLVRPQNFFSPVPWHAAWDTARTLLNRATGVDFPGTLAVRRSTALAMGGYDGDVIFENLELIRTVEAHGGSVASPLDLFVARLPPTMARFWGQRTRQAYDDFAIPFRMALWLAVIPGLATLLLKRHLRTMRFGAATCVLLAERGRRRSGGSTVFPMISSFLAPVWILERGVCAWLAVLQRLGFGGVRYGDTVIRVSANSSRRLRQRAAQSAAPSRQNPEARQGATPIAAANSFCSDAARSS
jgi:hypothetical protein